MSAKSEVWRTHQFVWFQCKELLVFVTLKSGLEPKAALTIFFARGTAVCALSTSQ